MSKLNQNQRKRAFELIDEKVTRYPSPTTINSAKKFLLKKVGKQKVALSDLINTINDSSMWRGYNDNDVISLLKYLNLEAEYNSYVEEMQNYINEQNKDLKVFVQTLKDEITFGTELDVIKEALDKLDNFMSV